MEAIIAVGFGCAILTRDGKCVYDENDVIRGGGDFDDCMTVEQAEALAAADPDHDWQITKHGPLHGETYQRQGDKHWVCVERNNGFA